MKNMQIVEKTENFEIIKKRSGRYGVRRARGQWINGDEKEKILSKEGFVKLSTPKPKEEPAAEEAKSEETAASE